MLCTRCRHFDAALGCQLDRQSQTLNSRDSQHSGVAQVADLVESKRTRATEIADLQMKHSSEISRLEMEMHARHSSEVARMEAELRELRNQRASEIWEIDKVVSALEAPAATIDDCMSTVSVCVKSSLKEVMDALEGQVSVSVEQIEGMSRRTSCYSIII
jgi:hypothetical protein